MAQAKVRIMPGRRSGLTSYPAYTGPQKTSAAFLQGDPVKITSGNLVAVSTLASQGTSSNLTTVATADVGNIIGFSDGLAAASVTSNIVVTRITEGQAFAANLVHGTASSAKASKRGTTVYLAKVTGETHWGFAPEAASKFSGSGASIVHGKIVDFIDAASTVNGRVLVEITKGGGLFV